MSAHRFDLDLTQPAQSGVYFVGTADLDRLAKAARRDELQVCRTDLGGCADKHELLQRLAVSLTLPASFGHNWDALADCLRDMGWLPAWGYVLLFERGDDLRNAAPEISPPCSACWTTRPPSVPTTTNPGSRFWPCPTRRSTAADRVTLRLCQRAHHPGYPCKRSISNWKAATSS